MSVLSPFQLQTLLADVVYIAVQAGVPIMHIYQSDFNVRYKADASPVTAADLESNKMIRSALEELSLGAHPRLPVLSEESASVNYSRRKSWSMFWVVDPLDGTKEFIDRNGQFTVNIGFVVDNRPMLGVVYAPALGLVYFAAGLLGAYQLQIDDLESFLFAPTPFEQLVARSTRLSSATEQRYARRDRGKYIVIGSRSHPSEDFNSFLSKMREKHGEVEVLAVGSALKFCRVAEGSADVYPRFGPTVEWDTAAGHAILNAVGKKVIVVETGEELSYNKENLINPWFIAQ